MEINKFLLDYYNNYDEDGRLKRYGLNLEYITTMKYINKYLKPCFKILEIGAGTGAYSVTLAQKGYDVTAVELIDHNLEILKKNSEGLSNIQCLQGNAVDLKGLKDNSFDLVLSLGPMYHLFTEEDKNNAIKEAIRVCKPNGIIMFAYLSHASIFWAYGIRKGCIEELQYALLDNGAIKDVPEEIFSSYYVEDFHKQFKNTNTRRLKDIATDSLTSIMRDYIQKLNDNQLKLLTDYHLKTCERKDSLGLSSHLLYICKKLG